MDREAQQKVDAERGYSTASLRDVRKRAWFSVQVEGERAGVVDGRSAAVGRKPPPGARAAA